MRAVVESPRLVQLQGINSERVSLMAWILSSILAGLAGVLIAPLSAQLDPLDFFALLVAAIAACVFGNLTSVVMTFVGGLLLGILQAELAGFLPTDSIVARGLRPSLPFAVLFVLVLVKQIGRSSGDVPDPLAGVDPPPAPPARHASTALDDERHQGVRGRRRRHRPVRQPLRARRLLAEPRHRRLSPSRSSCSRSSSPPASAARSRCARAPSPPSAPSPPRSSSSATTSR